VLKQVGALALQEQVGHPWLRQRRRRGRRGMNICDGDLELGNGDEGN